MTAFFFVAHWNAQVLPWAGISIGTSPSGWFGGYAELQQD